MTDPLADRDDDDDDDDDVIIIAPDEVRSVLRLLEQEYGATIPIEPLLSLALEPVEFLVGVACGAIGILPRVFEMYVEVLGASTARAVMRAAARRFLEVAGGELH